MNVFDKLARAVRKARMTTHFRKTPALRMRTGGTLNTTRCSEHGNKMDFTKQPGVSLPAYQKGVNAGRLHSPSASGIGGRS